MWEKLNFRESPYNVDPLQVCQEHVELLMGREEEEVSFQSAIDSSKQGVFVLSGLPGVGKTSFLNVQQFLLESGEAFVGPRILAARQLTSIQVSDEPRDIALRCISSLCKSIAQFCQNTKAPIPSETEKIFRWLMQNKPDTISGGFSLYNIGIEGSREVHIASLHDITFEGLVDIIQILANEAKEVLPIEGCFIVLDNMENIHEDDLDGILMTFRDTLFSLKNIWWVLIGQAGLYSMIQAIDPRVAQRISSNIDLVGISAEDLVKAVDARAVKFHNEHSEGTSPISKSFYTKLFETSEGEIRFVFQYCNRICIKFIEEVYLEVRKTKAKVSEDAFNKIMGDLLLKNRLRDEKAEQLMSTIINQDINGLYLDKVEKGILKLIGERESVQPKDYEDFKSIGVKSKKQFTNRYIPNLISNSLIARRQKGKEISYELRGIALFAYEYGLFDSEK